LTENARSQADITSATMAANIPINLNAAGARTKMIDTSGQEEQKAEE